MKQLQFEQAHAPNWQWFEDQTKRLEKRQGRLPAAESQAYLAAYRRLCNHLAIARSRAYSQMLQDRLNQLVRRGHWQIYRSRRLRWFDLVVFLRDGFPAAVAAHWRWVWVSSLLFYGLGLGFGLWAYFSPDAIFWLMDGKQVTELELMYDPSSEHIGRVRDDSTDVMMFGFYIYNNISIAFKTLASGLIFGLGSLFFVTFNGAFMGLAAGHLQAVGSGEPFWSFVIAHGAYELTAIVLAGAAGFQIGWALIHPGQLARLEALKRNAAGVVPMLYGIVLLLLLAAAIEAFWSSKSHLPVAIKYTVGGLCWLSVALYFRRTLLPPEVLTSRLRGRQARLGDAD